MGNKKCRDNIPDYFKHNGEIISGPKNIANGFNDFFTKIGPELASAIRE